jgi:hypothetical protein
VKALGSSGISQDGQFAATSSYLYESPSQLTADRAGRWSQQQNPVLIGGIAVADAIQIGLGAISVAQAGISSVSGGFSLNFLPASRLLVNEARQAMPGAQQSKQSYSTRLLSIGFTSPYNLRAEIIIEWEGNPYGEIGSVVVRRDLEKSTDFSKSECRVNITRIEKIPLPGTDPRTWPIVFTFDGVFDPVGNGHWEFSGEFEINAFGGLKFNRHQVVSRSLLDAGLTGTFVTRGADISVAVPTIPEDQLKYLKSRLP